MFMKENYIWIIEAMTAVLLPYITLHMIQVGITIEEVGIIYAILPFASCLGPPLAGKYYRLMFAFMRAAVQTLKGFNAITEKCMYSNEFLTSI